MIISYKSSNLELFISRYIFVCTVLTSTHSDENKIVYKEQIASRKEYHCLEKNIAAKQIIKKVV